LGIGSRSLRRLGGETMGLHRELSRIVVVGLLVAVVTSVSYTFAAANTVPTSKAGDGAGVISGFTITNVTYTLNATNPQNIDLAEFQASPTPSTGSTMRIKLVAAGGDWYSCVDPLTDGNLDCDTTVAVQATLAAADELRVVIAD
jgi:hypothetical protein